MKRIIVFGLVLIFLLSGLTGCGEDGNFLTGGVETEKEKMVSDEIYIPIEKIRTLNPVIMKDEDAYFINKLIYDGLFYFDENLAVKSALVDSFSYLDGGTTLSIKLKKGIQWHDGHSLTGEDVKFTIESYMSAAGSGESLFGKNIFNIKSVKVDKQDPLSVVISYSSPEYVSIKNLTFPIIPKHQFTNAWSVRSQSADFMPVGTGPYKVAGYNDLTHITLVGNEDYHGGDAPDNKLVFQILPNKVDAINLMNINNLAFTILRDIDRDTIFSNKNLNSVSFLSNQVEVIGFNHRKAHFQNKKVRQAIASAVNGKEILEIGYYNNGKLNDTIYYPGYLGTQSNAPYLYDLEKAKKLLAEAGYTDQDGDGIVENSAKEELHINILVNEDDKSRVAAAEIIKSGLDKLPVRSNVVSKSWEEYSKDLALGNFDIYMGGFQFNETYDLRPFLHTNYGNSIGYSNEKLDLLLAKMETGITQAEMKETFMEIQEILKEELPYCTLLYKTYGVVASLGLKGSIKPSFHHIYSGSNSWVYEYEVDKKVDKKN